MSGLVIDPKKCTRCGLCITQCPFNAMAMVDGQVQINAACKMLPDVSAQLSEPGDQRTGGRAAAADRQIPMA